MAFKTSVYIDDIPASVTKAVNQTTTGVSELFVHDVENMFAHTKCLHHLVFIKVWAGASGQVGMPDKGLKQYQLIVSDLLRVLHVSPPDA